MTREEERKKDMTFQELLANNPIHPRVQELQDCWEAAQVDAKMHTALPRRCSSWCDSRSYGAAHSAPQVPIDPNDLASCATDAQHWLAANMRNGVTAGDFATAMKRIIRAVEAHHGIAAKPGEKT